MYVRRGMSNNCPISPHPVLLFFGIALNLHQHDCYSVCYSCLLVYKKSQKCESFLYFAFSDKVQWLVYSTTSKHLLSSGDNCITSF